MLWWFAQNALIATALAAVVWPLCRIRRLGPAVRHALWLVVLLKLVTPPLVTWPWSAPSIFQWISPVSIGREIDSISWHELQRSSTEGDVAVDADTGTIIVPDLIEESYSLGEPRQVEGADAAELPIATINGESATLGARTQANSEVPVSVTRSEPARTTDFVGMIATTAAQLMPLVDACWLLGTAVSTLLHAIQIARFIRLVARFEQPSQSLLRQVNRVAATLRVRPPRVVVVAGIRSPVIWGAVRAQLIWPACLTTQARRAGEGSAAGSPRSRVGLRWDFESGRWDGVIAHELAHLRRRDHWVGWLELLAGCVWWWNPLFWYVRHQLRENAELACDALVVWALPDGRRTYAESLIEVVSHFSPVATPVPVLGVNSVARQAFERRLTMILCERVPWKLSARGLLAVGVLALVALPGWSLGQVATTPRSEDAPVKDELKAPAVVGVEVPVLVESQFVPVIESPGPAIYTQATVIASEPLNVQAPGDDSRMDALEKKLEALIAEVKAMRASRPPTGKYPAGAQSLMAPQPQPQSPGDPNVVFRTVPQGVNVPATRELHIAARAAGAGGDVQLLSRGTYPMPKDKAEALAEFLREHMKATVEAGVKDDDGKTSLVVTASPEAQTTIAQFIALSEGKQPSATPAQHQLRLTLPQAPPKQNIYHYQKGQPPQATPTRESAPAKPAEPPSDTSAPASRR